MLQFGAWSIFARLQTGLMGQRSKEHVGRWWEKVGSRTGRSLALANLSPASHTLRRARQSTSCVVSSHIQEMS
jgi:hypothetical protein